MDNLTKEYRSAQLDRVKTEYHAYKTKIKIIKPNGETNWLDIENNEFKQISAILTGKVL